MIFNSSFHKCSDGYTDICNGLAGNESDCSSGAGRYYASSYYTKGNDWGCWLHANIWLIWSPWFVYLACVIILSSFPQGSSKSSSTSQSQNGQTQKTTIIQPSQTHSGQQFIVTSKACYSKLSNQYFMILVNELWGKY